MRNSMITGKTRVWSILADPIGHVKTPQEINALCAAQGIDGVMVPMQVHPENLATAVAGLKAIESFGGFVVTVPHKTKIVALCDRLIGDAARIGAVNVVRREADGTLTGAILDGLGFVEGLRSEGIEPRGMDACLLGAGGAGAAIAFALAEAGVRRLTIVNRSQDKAEDLAARVAQAYPEVPVAAGAPETASRDLIVNATSLGLKPDDPLPLDDTAFHTGQVVADAIMDPVETRLLAAARAAGARVHPGLPMLRQQIRLMAEHLGALPRPPQQD
ncbi:shikimate dehydrogenase [Rhodovulum sulfidophilum]|uniref:shikimate dehydrogenase (NADP(+)) n=2 Tax=Rhodovulum sulfidophilum TaxID=35806 RepID=A0ABS1RWJ5_RHOSU|nr:shikimate dehydrogenase [Rhodovulum sulfidophilum]